MRHEAESRLLPIQIAEQRATVQKLSSSAPLKILIAFARGVSLWISNPLGICHRESESQVAWKWVSTRVPASEPEDRVRMHLPAGLSLTQLPRLIGWSSSDKVFI